MSPHGHNADGRLSLRKEEAQSSLRPTSSRVMTWTLAKEDSFQDGGSRGLQRLSRQRWLSSPPGTMWQGGGRTEFSGVCAPISKPKETRRHHHRQAPGVSSLPARGVCSTPSAWRGLSSSRGSVWKNPCQGRVGRPKVSPTWGLLGQQTLRFHFEALSEHLGCRMIIMFREAIF